MTDQDQEEMTVTIQLTPLGRETAAMLRQIHAQFENEPWKSWATDNCFIDASGRGWTLANDCLLFVAERPKTDLLIATTTEELELLFFDEVVDYFTKDGDEIPVKFEFDDTHGLAEVRVGLHVVWTDFLDKEFIKLTDVSA